MQSTKLRVADVELELLDTGQGAARPVLFLHGGGGFSPQQPFVAPFSEKRRFVAPTHPGFGKSTLPDWLDSIDDIAHLYLELMDILKLDGIDLVGYTFGDAVGEARQRHGQGIDGVGLGIPFRRDCVCDRTRRRNRLAAGRRFDRLAIKCDGKSAVGLAYAGTGIKALALRRARRAPHGLLRIKRGLSRHFIE